MKEWYYNLSPCDLWINGHFSVTILVKDGRIGGGWLDDEGGVQFLVLCYY